MSDELRTVEEVASEIKQRIARLTDFDGDNLKGEMASLKAALIANPAACSLLEPEDIGMAVASIRRMVGTALIGAAIKEKKPTKASAAAELKAAMDSVTDDDF